ncbi:probable inactive ATP-dependent zinc metalloprotease FTSHI 5, chloroplastic [Argentina anserina]|uniref:probable inactive ATP-dependent zinc metalloprotease FTSHI 5, chloroplastic n=1 Tax=Argentina anserina TaxID=57926 RepID=UPI00217671B2|nr:probable inactive ATP-dependent zinc metalloprotease FTSHI 5, chloroplastic [Potentilla anserina]
MDSSVLALRSLPNPFTPHRNIPSSIFTPNRRLKIQTRRLNSTSIRYIPKASVFPEPPATSEKEPRPVLAVAKHVVLALVCFGVGFTPFRSPPAAMAAVERKEVSYESEGYSAVTKRLLETAAVLVRRVEEDGGDVKAVEEAWRAVKAKKEELQREILEGMQVELRRLRRSKEGMVRRCDEIVEEVENVREVEKAARSSGEAEAKERVERMEEEYGELWESVGEIEDEISRRETAALSYGVRELCFIERECEQLVQSFTRRMRRRRSNKSVESVPKKSVTKLSKSDIQRDLENTQRRLLEQVILTNVVEVDEVGPLFTSTEFARNIKQGLEESRKMQIEAESQIRKKVKKFGEEKRYLVQTPEEEVVKGFPEVELKWMFGKKEVVVPKAAGLRLYHGWKKWREEAKADLKRNLIEDVDFGKEYVARRQELILLDRDRLVSKTWYNEEKNRWEIDPVAVPFAVSKKLVERARIRHDWAAMYIALKGDDKEYYVDIKEYEMLFEEFGGFDGLYMKMLACGIPTAVHLMWIPLSELDLRQQFLLTVRLSHQCFNALWKTTIVSYARDWVVQKIKNINDDIMMTIVFPIVELILPYYVRIQLGMAWPEEIDQAVDSTWYLKWQSEAEMNYKKRKTDDLQWYIWFLMRTVAYGYVLFHVFGFLKREVPSVLGYGPIRTDPNREKLRRVKYYLNYRVRKVKQNKKAGVDPITRAFDDMKRVKNPPIPLKDFASIESMKEEINEVVAFLKNPKAFQEMGARAPRGVLIVGERGTGKTSLALAIAAQARVPVVNIKAQELEAGLWVGQSASNVRELFQTARELAPVIIFVEDFDLFAGVRGKFIHTKNQDHEAFINQLLVELDGFEKQDGVVLMATTGNLKQIDDALQRPGRMDRIFHLQRPTQAEREKILHIAAKETMDNELIDFVDWKKVAEKTALLRPIELKLVPASLEGSAFRSKFLDADELMSYTSWFATFSTIIPEWVRTTKMVKKLSKSLVIHLGLTLTKEDLQSVVDLMEPYGQISNGIELLNPPLEWTREIKFPHAVWAAGRGLIALLLPNFDVVDNIWLEPLSWQGIGCTKITKARNEGSVNGNSESRSYLEKKLVFCFGSHIAAQMLLPFGEENLLSSSELTQAQEIATRMVIQYGWGPDDSPAIYYHSNASTALSMGNNHEYDIAVKVEKIHDLAYYKAKEMLNQNRRVLEKMVEELLEFEILTAKDLGRIFEGNGGIREKEPFFLSGAHDRETLSGSFLEGGDVAATVLLT